MRTSISVAGFVCAVHVSSAAAQTTDSPQTPVQEMRRISVTATRSERELDQIAGTVSVKNEADVANELAYDIKDLVRYEPGVSVGNAPTRFGLAGFNIRGIDGNRVLIRIDDARMSDAFAIGSFADARRNLIDLDAVKSVEIIRGAASALYGSDAIGGVVSFALKDPHDYLADRGAYFSTRSGYESDSDGWFAGSTVALGNDRLAALLHYTHRDGHEIDNQGSVTTRDRTRTAPNPQTYSGDSALAKLSWNVSDEHLLSFTLEGQRGDRTSDVYSSVGIANGVFTEALRGDDESERGRFGFAYEYLAPTLWFDTLEWRAHIQDSSVDQRTHEQRYTVTAGPVSRVTRDRTFTFEQQTLGSEWIARKEIATGTVTHLLTYGVDLTVTDTEQMRDGMQTNVTTGARTANILPDAFPVRDFPNTRTRQYAAFVQDEIAVADWTITPGVRLDRYSLSPHVDAIFRQDNPTTEQQSLTEDSISPKLGVVWSISDELSAFAQYARGFRAPPYNDVNIGFTNFAFGYTAIANPDLKSETSDGFEVGLRGVYPRGYFSLASFYNEYDDFIESLTVVGVQNGIQIFQSRNLAEARIYGAEFRGGLDIGTGWHLRGSIAYARGEDRVAEEPLNSVDPLKAVVGLAYTPANRLWHVELVGTGVDRPRHIDHSAGDLFVPESYVTLDLLARTNVGDRVTVQAGVFNLFDEKYWEWTDVRGRPANDAVIDRYSRPGLNASVSASVRF